jgi:hypothetical protein
MECISLVDHHQLVCPWFTVVFVLFCIYTLDNLFPRPIVNLQRVFRRTNLDYRMHLFGGLFQTSKKKRKNRMKCRHFFSYLVFFSSIRVDPGPTNRCPTSLLALKIRTPVVNTGKLRSIGQMPVLGTDFHQQE